MYKCAWSVKRPQSVWEKMSVSFLALYHTWLFSYSLCVFFFVWISSFFPSASKLNDMLCMHRMSLDASVLCVLLLLKITEHIEHTKFLNVCVCARARASKLFLPSLFYFSRVYKIRIWMSFRWPVRCHRHRTAWICFCYYCYRSFNRHI